MSQVDGVAFRKAVRANKLGDEDSERVYKGPVRPVHDDDISTFTRAISSRLEEPYTGAIVKSSDRTMSKIIVQSEKQQEQQDFGDEVPEVEIIETLHSFVELSTGNVFLPLLDESGPNTSFGPRCNVTDETSFDHALTAKGMMLPFKGSARMLLELGVNVDTPNEWGETCLMYACSLLSDSLITWLVAHGANPNASTKGSQATALHRLVEANGSDERKGELVRLLVSKGGDINKGNVWGVTPLHLAAIMVQPYTVRALLEAGALKATRDIEGRTPAVLLAMNKDEFARKKNEAQAVMSLLA